MLLHDLDIPQVYRDNSLERDVLDYTEDDQFDVILMIIWSFIQAIQDVHDEAHSLLAA